MTHAEILEMAREIVADPLQKSPHPKATGLASALVESEAKLAAAQAALVDFFAESRGEGQRIQYVPHEQPAGFGEREWNRHLAAMRDVLANGADALDAALARAREEGATAMRGAAVALSVTTRLRPDRPQERIAPSDVLTVAREAVAAYRDAIAALPTVAR